MYRRFLFATGIENSIPVIDNGRRRMDEMEKCRHYQFWQKDFDLVKEMGIEFLRYGPPIHTTYTGAGKYDWSFSDTTLNYLKRSVYCPSSTFVTSGCPTGSAISRIRTSLNYLRNTAGHLPGDIPGYNCIPLSMKCTYAHCSLHTMDGGMNN